MEWFQLWKSFICTPLTIGAWGQPLKPHIKQGHHIEHFELTRETLLKYANEICEAIHSQYSIFDLKHKYVYNKKNSDTHLDMKNKSLVHFNWICAMSNSTVKYMLTKNRIASKFQENTKAVISKDGHYRATIGWWIFFSYWIEGQVTIINILADIDK